jgi:hypothetical protein
MIKLVIAISLILFVSGCASKYDYSIHKPKVRFKPSTRALSRLNYETKGHKYLWGAENNGKYDCSGLTYYTFGSMGIEIPRVARDQYRVGTPIARSELQKGDLVFFDTSRNRSGRVTHVGIYLGNGKFQHASSSKKRVVVSSLSNSYYRSRYLGARRMHTFNDNKVFKPQVQEPIYFAKSTTKPVPTQEPKQPTNVFATQANSINEQAKQTQTTFANNYYILLHPSPNVANEIITKLELSGLQGNLVEQGNTILVGPFNSKSEAMQIKNFNPELLANATIRNI